VARRGLVRTFQNIRLFKQLTVVKTCWSRSTAGQANCCAACSTRRLSPRRAEALGRGLNGWTHGPAQLANREAGTLSYGHQRRLEIARCMITKPRLLMLDEPAAGLNPQEKIELQQLIDRCAASSTSPCC
jgi:branched-chain amino acid transport system ATP-binding protein